jgi:hypothetical protein
MKSLEIMAPTLAAAALLLCSCSKTDETVVETVRTYQIGEKVSLPPLNYAVFEKQWAPQLGSGAEARLPQTRFFLVRISATNIGKASAFVPNMVLEDDNGGTCAELEDGTGAPHWLGYLRSVKPADSIQGNVLFDCAPKHYKLKLTNEDGKVAYVDLPLSFDSTDTTVDVLRKDESGEKLKHPK